MHRRVGNEHRREQGLRRLQPYVAHDHHCCMVVHVEERESSPRWLSGDDQEGVKELQHLGEVEHVGPEEEGPSGRGLRGEADDPMEVGCMGEGGEGAAKRHDEGEDEEDEVMDGWDWLEEGWVDGWEWEVVEEESEEEVGDDGEGEEERRGAKGLALGPWEMEDGWVVD